MKRLFFRLHFSQTSITRLTNHGGHTFDLEFTIIQPNDLGDSLESVNYLKGNSSGKNAKIYFVCGKIMKLKALSTDLRRCFTVNRISDIRLIKPEEVSIFVEFMKYGIKRVIKCRRSFFRWRSSLIPQTLYILDKKSRLLPLLLGATEVSC